MSGKERPEADEKKLHKAIQKALLDDKFYNSVEEAMQAYKERHTPESEE